MKHLHHIVPKHMGGTDEPSNLVYLSIEEHAEAHRVLYEAHGKWQDFLAWQGLSGRMISEDVHREAMSRPNLGVRRSPATEFKKGIPPKTAGKVWITNGSINKAHNPDVPLPDGWRRGQIKKGYTVSEKVGRHTRTPEIRAKQSRTMLAKSIS